MCNSLRNKRIEKGYKSKELLNNLGIAYLATKDNTKSKMMFEEALKIDASINQLLII